jgi:hypothetical protein
MRDFGTAKASAPYRSRLMLFLGIGVALAVKTIEAEAARLMVSDS